jgi:hypothetical protein
MKIYLFLDRGGGFLNVEKNNANLLIYFVIL